MAAILKSKMAAKPYLVQLYNNAFTGILSITNIGIGTSFMPLGDSQAEI